MCGYSASLLTVPCTPRLVPDDCCQERSSLGDLWALAIQQSPSYTDVLSINWWKEKDLWFIAWLGQKKRSSTLIIKRAWSQDALNPRSFTPGVGVRAGMKNGRVLRLYRDFSNTHSDAIVPWMKKTPKNNKKDNSWNLIRSFSLVLSCVTLQSCTLIITDVSIRYSDHLLIPIATSNVTWASQANGKTYNLAVFHVEEIQQHMTLCFEIQVSGVFIFY